MSYRARHIVAMATAVACLVSGAAVAQEKPLTRYAPRFHGVLPPRKVARFYQIEDKLRALLDYQLARDIPFVK